MAKIHFYKFIQKHKSYFWFKFCVILGGLCQLDKLLGCTYMFCGGVGVKVYFVPKLKEI